MASQYQDTPEDIKPPLNMASDNNSNQSGIFPHIKEEKEEPDITTDIKVEHDIYTSDIKVFEPSLIKTEYDEFSEFELKCIKEEQSMTCDTNVENSSFGDDVAGPSSLYELTSEVDLGIVKMEDEVITSELSEKEDMESSEQYSAHSVRRFKQMNTQGEKSESFDGIKREKTLLTKLSLDDHTVAFQSSSADVTNNVISRIHRCKHCKYITGKKRGLDYHMRTHREILETTFDCIKCRKEFSSKYYRDRHIVTYHSNNDEMMNSVTCKLNHCKYCKYITVDISRMGHHLKTHGMKPEKTFDCIKCEKEFLTKYHLDRHIVTHHSNNGEMMNSVTCKINRCKYCKYIAVDRRRLTQHMRTHGESSEKTFDCIQNEKEFSSKYTLDKHIVAQHSSSGEVMNHQ